jgi:hypothetical protein
LRLTDREKIDEPVEQIQEERFVFRPETEKILGQNAEKRLFQQISCLWEMDFPHGRAAAFVSGISQ